MIDDDAGELLEDITAQELHGNTNPINQTSANELKKTNNLNFDLA